MPRRGPRNGKPPARGRDDVRVELDHLQPQRGKVAPHPLRRRAAAEADEEDAPRAGVVREAEVEVVGVEETGSVRVGEPHTALERAVETKEAGVIVIGDDEAVISGLPRLAHGEAAK